MLLISWNVAGWARSLDMILAHYKSLSTYLDRMQADVFCIQEVKIPRRKLVEGGNTYGAKLEGWETFWAPCSDSTFNGVATFVRTGLCLSADTAPLKPEHLNTHGRCIRTDHELFVIFNVYCPAGSNKLGTSFKLEFLCALRSAMANARSTTGKPVILCGDLNIASCAQDVHWTWRNVCVDDVINSTKGPIRGTTPQCGTTGMGETIFAEPTLAGSQTPSSTQSTSQPVSQLSQLSVQSTAAPQLLSTQNPARQSALRTAFTQTQSASQTALQTASAESTESIPSCNTDNSNGEQHMSTHMSTHMPKTPMSMSPVCCAPPDASVIELTERVYRKCRQDLVDAWPRICELLKTKKRIVEEETRNSLTQQKYLRYRVVVDVTEIDSGEPVGKIEPAGKELAVATKSSSEKLGNVKAKRRKIVKLGKPFPNKDHAEWAYSISGYRLDKGNGGGDDDEYGSSGSEDENGLGLTRSVCVKSALNKNIKGEENDAEEGQQIKQQKRHGGEEEDNEEVEWCTRPNTISMSTLTELLCMLTGITWDTQTQRLFADYAGTSPTSLPALGWLHDLFKMDKMVDTFRFLYPPCSVSWRFTCWNQYKNSRYVNEGGRIDSFVVDESLTKFVRRGKLLTQSNLVLPACHKVTHTSQPEKQQCEPETSEVDKQHATFADLVSTHVSTINEFDMPIHNAVESENAGLMACTYKGMFSQASFAGVGLTDASMEANNSQFLPGQHTGILYTPPKYSDHVAISLLLDVDALLSSGAVFGQKKKGTSILASNHSSTRQAQPHHEQRSIRHFFGGGARATAAASSTPTTNIAKTVTRSRSGVGATSMSASGSKMFRGINSVSGFGGNKTSGGAGANSASVGGIRSIGTGGSKSAGGGHISNSGDGGLHYDGRTEGRAEGRTENGVNGSIGHSQSVVISVDARTRLNRLPSSTSAPIDTSPQPPQTGSRQMASHTKSVSSRTPQSSVNGKAKAKASIQDWLSEPQQLPENSSSPAEQQVIYDQIMKDEKGETKNKGRGKGSDVATRMASSNAMKRKQGQRKSNMKSNKKSKAGTIRSFFTKRS